MRRTLSQMVAEFREHWKNYIIQSTLATLVLLLALWVMSAQQMVLIASLGATSFIVFALPNAVTARARNVIGGHLVGLACGSLCHLLAVPGSPTVIVAYAVAVGISMFLMVVLDVEHPPAAGTALGVAILGASWGVFLAVVTGTALLALAHRALRRWLRDLA